MNATTPHSRRQQFGPVHLLKKGRLAEQAQTSQKTEAGDNAHMLLTVALTAAHSAPDTRQDRIEAIRAQIESGAYQIDSRKIAESIIRENPELFKN